MSAWRSSSLHLVRVVTWPRLRQHLPRTFSTLIGVALGAGVVVAVATVNHSISDSFRQTILDIAGKADLEVRGGSGGFDEGLLERVRETPGVVHAAAVLEQTVRIACKGAADEDLLLIGVDLLNADDSYFRDESTGSLPEIARDPLGFLNSPHHLVVSHSLAARLGLGLHDSIPLRTPSGVHDFEIWGFLDGQGLGRAFGGAVAVMDAVAMQVAFERGHNVDHIDVGAAPGGDVDQLSERLRTKLGSAFSVLRPERRGARVSRMIGSLSSGLGMASAVAMLVGAFLVYSTMSMSVVQRRHEIGTLRALGMTRRQIVSLFTLEGLLLGALGSLIGLGFGVALSKTMLFAVQGTLRTLSVQVSLEHAHVTRSALLAGLSLGTLTSVVASGLPALRAARVTPSEVLAQGRHVRVSLTGRRRALADGLALSLLGLSIALLFVRVGPAALRGYLACFAAALAGALIMPGFVQLVHATTARLSRGVEPGSVLGGGAGTALRLANDGLVRDLGRTSSAAAALMIGVAMSLSFGSFVDSFTQSTLRWVDQMLHSDLWVASGARTAGGTSSAMSDTLYAPLSALPGVELVERVRMADVDFRDTTVKLIALDSAVFPTRARMLMIAGEPRDAASRLGQGEVVLSENLARKYDLAPGDAIELAAAEGPRRFRVAAVVVEYTSDQGSILIDRSTYLALWHDSRIDSYKLYLRPGADKAGVQRAIEARWQRSHDIHVLSQAEFRAEIERILAQTFGVMHVLELVAVVIAVLGVINAVLANVMDRAREYGLLRAIGMQRRELCTMVVFEAALIGSAGALLGVGLGFGIGYVLLTQINAAQTGWYLPFVPSLAVALSSALPVVVGAACAGTYPAAVAARHPITNALAYE